jgi:hypothetical protein
MSFDMFFAIAALVAAGFAVLSSEYFLALIFVILALATTV